MSFGWRRDALESAWHSAGFGIVRCRASQRPAADGNRRRARLQTIASDHTHTRAHAPKLTQTLYVALDSLSKNELVSEAL